MGCANSKGISPPGHSAPNDVQNTAERSLHNVDGIPAVKPPNERRTKTLVRHLPMEMSQEKEHTMSSPDEQNNFLGLPDEVLAGIFSAAGPANTARCSSACSQLHSVQKNHPTLWRNFVKKDFRLLGDGGACKDWQKVYAYLSTKLSETGHPDKDPLSATVFFADDGTASEPPENAVQSGKARPYSTGQGVLKDVDLVIDLGQVCLITGFAIANHCPSCSGPLKDALVFASIEPPNLEHKRQYDGIVGSGLAAAMESLVEKRYAARPRAADPHPFAFRRQPKRDISGHVSHTPSSDTEPIAGFLFPEPPECYHVRLVRHCRPVVGRYIHFKLLNVYDPYRHGEIN
jgi:hypothetical protein